MFLNLRENSYRHYKTNLTIIVFKQKYFFYMFFFYHSFIYILIHYFIYLFIYSICFILGVHMNKYSPECNQYLL